MQHSETGPEPEINPKLPAQKPRKWLSPAVFLAILLLALVLHRCYREPPPPISTLPLLHPAGLGKADSLPSVQPETLAKPETLPQTIRPVPNPTLPPPPLQIRVAAPVDSGPYLYADPWGGRHFDSVSVSLHCREGCVILYSFEDSVHFKTYDQPFLFRRNTTLWISGIDSLNRQASAIRVDYIIERNPGACAPNSMPLNVQGKAICMDIYEWPNRGGENPKAFVNQKEAADSCKQAGKRLCSESEWKEGCQGPDHAVYPYGGKYNENYCPAKEAAMARSGRNPVCRSYYGLFDLTGNLWEWTSTPSKGDADFFMVMGGNWDTGNEAACGLAKFSFYPTVRYPFVGFRCCQDIPSK